MKDKDRKHARNTCIEIKNDRKDYVKNDRKDYVP